MRQLARHHRLGVAQLAAVVGIRPQRVPGFVQKLRTALRGQELRELLELEGEGSDATMVWRGLRVEG